MPKICEKFTCRISAIYNYPEISSPIYCSNHKLDRMIDVINNRCINKNCGLMAKN